MTSARQDALPAYSLDRIRARQVEAVYRNVTVGLVISLRLRFENLDLTESLRRQRDLATFR